MKNLRIFIFQFIAIFAINYFAFAGNLNISNLKPRQGITIPVTYQSTTLFQDCKVLYLAEYFFDEKSSELKSNQFKLEKIAENQYKSEIKIPEYSPIAWFSIFSVDNNQQTEDNNHNRFWTIEINRDSIGFKDAKLSLGLLYSGYYPSKISPTTDLYRAWDYFKEELKINPNNFKAKIAKLTIDLDLNKIIHADFVDKILALRKDLPNDNEVVLNYINILKTQKKLKEVEEIEREYLTKFSNIKYIENIDFTKLSEATSYKEFEEYANSFLMKYPNSDKKDMVLNGFIQAKVSTGNFNDIVQLYMSHRSKFVMNDITFFNVLLNDSIYYSKNKGIFQGIYDTLFHNFFNTKNQIDFIPNIGFLPEKLEEMERKKILSTAFNELAEINLKIGNNAFIKPYLLKSIAISGEKNLLNKAGSYAALISHLLEINANDDSLHTLRYNLIKRAINAGKRDQTLLNEYESIYSKNGVLDTLVFYPEKKKGDSLAKIEIKKELLNNQINEDLPPFILRSFDKRYIENSDLAGNNNILFFWNSGNEQSLYLLDYLEEEYPKYVNENVKMWLINEGDNDKLNEKLLDKIKFPEILDTHILLDDANFSRKIPLSNIPGVVIVDKNKKIQFIQSGFENEDEFELYLESALEILK